MTMLHCRRTHCGLTAAPPRVCAQLVMQMVLNRGDTFLVEEYAYSHLLEGVAEPKGYVPLPVPIDAHGMVPAGLRQASRP